MSKWMISLINEIKMMPPRKLDFEEATFCSFSLDL